MTSLPKSISSAPLLANKCGFSSQNPFLCVTIAKKRCQERRVQYYNIDAFNATPLDRAQLPLLVANVCTLYLLNSLPPTCCKHVSNQLKKGIQKKLIKRAAIRPFKMQCCAKSTVLLTYLCTIFSSCCFESFDSVLGSLPSSKHLTYHMALYENPSSRFNYRLYLNIYLCTSIQSHSKIL